MNILSISSIMPEINDFVFEFYSHYLDEMKQDRVFFILPVKRTNKLIRKIAADQFDDSKISRLKVYYFNHYKVSIFKYLSIWRYCNIHALLSVSLYFFNRKALDQLITGNNINVVHAQNIYPDGMLAYYIRKRYHIPYIITSHNELRYFNHFISKRLAMKIFRNAYKVTPLNYSNYQTFLQNKLNNIIHIPLGFDEKFLRLKRKNNHDEVRIITVARLVKLKNIDKVIHALYSINQKYHFRYTIVGDGPEKEYLTRLVNQYNMQDRIQLTGKIPYQQIADVLSEHDIFVMPSYFETFGRVYFEAMALKIPVICAKYSGIYGFFEEMKEGISVDHTDISDIADKLAMLISDKSLRQTIGLQGHELVKNYTWKNLAVRFNHLYNDSIQTDVKGDAHDT